MPESKSVKCTMDLFYFCAILIITCIDILLIYRKDRRDGDSFDIIEENECLLIEIVGGESFGKKYLQQLQQLRNEMWTGSFDLFKISKEGERNTVDCHFS